MIGYDKTRKTYYVKWNFRDPVTGKWKTTHKRGFKLKREATEFEASIKLAKANNDEPVATEYTFMEMNDMYEKANQISETQKQKRHTNFRLRFPLKDKKINKISKTNLEKWRTELVNNPDYATRTKNETIAFVKSVFNFAHEFYNVPNTAAFIKPAKFSDEEIMSQEKPVWSVEQYEKFSSCVDNELYKIFFDFLFWTGCRRGEAMAIQKVDVNLKNKTVYIHYSIKHFKNGLKPTKTRTSRLITIDDTLFEEIRPLMNEDGPFLFGGERSLPITVIQSQFTRAKKKAGLNGKVTIHCLRHSHVSYLINNGVNLMAVSKRIGHADIETTSRVYAHLLEDTNTQMMNIINRNHK